MKPLSIVYLLNGSEHIYWILDLEDEVHSIWDSQSSDLQECKANFLFEVGWGGQQFSVGFKNFPGDCPRPDLTPQKVCREVFNVWHSSCTDFLVPLYGVRKGILTQMS